MSNTCANSNLRIGLVLAVALALPPLLTSVRVEAQQAGALEEIVVTARKRGAEVLQDVPATITAFSGDTLNAMGVLDFDDFAYQVPGLTFSDEGAGQKRYVLRGIQSAGQQQVAVYYDETPLPGIQGASGNSGSQTSDLKLYDLERVEVLKGPQGTTFGANSQMGTVRFILNKPDLSEFGGSIMLGSGQVDSDGFSSQAYGMVNLPIVEDKLALRLVGYYDDQAGYLDNQRLNKENYNWYETKGLRGMLRFTPNDRITLDAMAWIQDRKNGGTDRYNDYPSFSDSPDNLDFVNNDLQPLEDIRKIAAFETGEFLNGDFAQTRMPDDQEVYSLTMNWDLGSANLVATGSYYDRDFGFKRDSSWVLLRLGVVPEPSSPDDPPANRGDLFPALTDQTQDVEQMSFEARLNSTTDSPLQWMGGVFYRERESGFRSFVPVVEERTGLTFNPGQPSGYIDGSPGEGIDGCNPCVFARDNQRKIEEVAVFGEITYALTDQWELMAGARWFEAEQTDSGLQFFPFALFPPSSFNPVADKRAFKEDDVLTKWQLSYTPNEDMVLYGLASQGFRLGGTNQQGVVAVPPGYEADDIWNYEIGAKTTWMDGRLNLNISGFYVDWSDLQVAGSDPTGAFGFIGNAGSAEVTGMEVELISQPTDALYFSGGFSYLFSHELKEDQTSNEVVAPGRDGDELPFVPEFTANAMAQYNFPLDSDGWEVFARGAWSYRGDSNSELDTSSRFNRKQEDYQIVDLRFGVDNVDYGLNIAFYVNNVFDEQGDVRVRVEDSLLTVKWTNMPRTMGVELRKTF